MKGYINIIGEIGYPKGVTLKDVIKQVQQQPDATSFDVIINSGGGSYYEGFDIYDYLISLNKPITTIGVGMVASIATIPFAAGSTRILKPGTKFMIHLPSGGVEGSADYIETYVKELKAAQTKIADFYKAKLNVTDEAIYPLLKNETWFTPEEARDFGFANGVELEIEANFKIDKMNLNNEDRNWIENMFNKLLGTKKDPKNMTLTTAEGQIVDFSKVEEGASPSIGDEATIDGELADGEILMSTGEIYIFEKGKLIEIKNDVEDETNEVDALKAENEALKAEIEALKAEIENQKTSIENTTKEIKNFKRQITSKFKVDADEDVVDPREKKTEKRKLFKD